MNLANNVIINLFSMIILIIINSQSRKSSEKNSFQNKLFTAIVYTTVIMLIADIFSRFDGNIATIYPSLNYLGNFIIFFMSPILPSIWFAYVHYQIFQEKSRTRKLTYPLMAINLINIIILILTQKFGWYYYIDSSNIYHRGRFYLLSAGFVIALVFASYILIIINRKRIEKRYYSALLFFSVPPLILIFVQINFYGISLMLNGVVISILIVFLNIQNQNIYTDYLTGISNRNRLEIYIEDKISTSTREKTFSAIMIDLNDFKSINDTFGHDIGDKALCDTVELLSGCIRSNDLLARYGGDEFWVILDTSDIGNLEKIVSRMKSSFEEYNRSNKQAFELDFSYGYAVYDYSTNVNSKEFKKHVDKMMYENKRQIKRQEKNRLDNGELIL